MPEFHFYLRVREKEECHKADTAHVVWIRIHKTEGCPIWSVNYCHAEGAEELLKSWLWIATPTPSPPLLSFFFWVQTHVDHHAFFLPQATAFLTWKVLTVGFHNHTATQLTARWNLVFYAFLDINHCAELLHFLQEASVVKILQTSLSRAESVFFHYCSLIFWEGEKRASFLLKIWERITRLYFFSQPTLKTEQCTHSTIITCMVPWALFMNCSIAQRFKLCFFSPF